MTEDWMDLEPGKAVSMEIRRVMKLLVDDLQWAQKIHKEHRLTAATVAANLYTNGHDLRNRCLFALARLLPDSEEGKLLLAHRPDLIITSKDWLANISQEYVAKRQRLVLAADILLENIVKNRLTPENIDLSLELFKWDEINAMELLGHMAR